MKEIIVDELPETCGDCAFRDFVPDPDGPDTHYCKAREYIGLDDEMGTNNSEFDKNYTKIRDSRCPLKLKGYVPQDIAVKMIEILLNPSDKYRRRLREVFEYFMNVKGENNDTVK